jgi:hypothetical protein
MGSRNITKKLSANDVGATGAHQAGILIPKNEDLLSFFPSLEKELKNPRVHIKFIDQSGYEWTFAFIYYNNKGFGGTRNEYRLTRMTNYINSNLLKEGDEIEFAYNTITDVYSVSFTREEKTMSGGNLSEDGVLRIGTSWKVINIGK